MLGGSPYILGQGGQDERAGLSTDFAEQVAPAYRNLGAVINALGARPDQVVKLVVCVVDHDMSKLGVLTQNVIELFGDALTAQTLVPVPKLAIEPMMFEVEAVVALDYPTSHRKRRAILSAAFLFCVGWILIHRCL